MRVTVVRVTVVRVVNGRVAGPGGFGGWIGR